MMSRAGHDYYSLIARAVDALHINVRETRLTLYERARRAQMNSFDPAIPEVEFRRERTALDKAIRAIEIKAAATDDERTKRDRKIVSDYATFLEKATTRPDCFYDARALPHPKEAIIAAIEREIVRATPGEEEYVDWLRSGGQFMWNYLEGIGTERRPIEGYSQLPGGSKTAEPDDLGRIVASLEYIRDVERSASLEEIAKKEDKKVEERIAAAILIWREVRR